MLLDELNHRVKNTLATVQSLASQTAGHAKSADDLYGRLESRLLALSRAHDLLTKRHWEATPRDGLAHEVLEPVAGLGRILIDGPPVEIGTWTALNLTMTLNELATNALKYGSLASDEGTVSVTWDMEARSDGSFLILDWREKGGAPVTPPMRRGVGSRLMERCIERDLGCTLDLVFNPEGVSCRISCPVAADNA